MGEQMWLLEDSLANLSVQPGSRLAKKITATSGRKWLELYPKSGPLGSLVRMLVGSSEWASTIAYLTWNISVTKRKRWLFRLVPSGSLTDEIECSFWPTPTTMANQLAPSMMKHKGCREFAKRYDKITPSLCEEMMGFPEGWTLPD